MATNSEDPVDSIKAICTAFGGDHSTKASIVAKAQVLEWMSSPHLEVRGALYSKIATAGGVKCVEPALDFEDFYGFVIPYLEQCIEQNPDGEWVDSRYLAGHQLVAWIVDFWNKETVPRKRLTDIKNRLADLYKRGDEGVRDAVVNAVLEHLFEQRQIATYFKDWKNDPVLAEAYGAARSWSEKI
jgi:hypothetical protein